jgi:hypothetical protein
VQPAQDAAHSGAGMSPVPSTTPSYAGDFIET